MKSIIKYIVLFVLLIAVLCSCNKYDVVKHSTIDPDSDLAKSAIDGVTAYISEYFSENPEVEDFVITDAEIDWAVTDQWLYLYTSTSNYDLEDLLNNFLVIKTKTEVKLKDGVSDTKRDTFPDYDLSEPLVWKVFVMYDPYNKEEYAFSERMGETQWKGITSSFGNYDIERRSDKELYEWLYKDQE